MYRKHFGEKLEKVIVGYTGGTTARPSYRQVCTGATGHAEAIQITFDPDVVSYESLVNFFFRMHGISPILGFRDLLILISSKDPTTLNAQGIYSRIYCFFIQLTFIRT